jgi:hypothetical protein
VHRIDEPVLMAGSAAGTLEGNGTWRLFEQGGITAVTFDWEVRTTPAWMNAAAPLARPLFGAGHDRLMRRGGRDLAQQLGAPLVACG